MKHTWDLCIISYNCMWTCNFLEIQNFKKREREESRRGKGKGRGRKRGRKERGKGRAGGEMGSLSTPAHPETSVLCPWRPQAFADSPRISPLHVARIFSAFGFRADSLLPQSHSLGSFRPSLLNNLVVSSIQGPLQETHHNLNEMITCKLISQ